MTHGEQVTGSMRNVDLALQRVVDQLPVEDVQLCADRLDAADKLLDTAVEQSGASGLQDVFEALGAAARDNFDAQDHIEVTRVELTAYAGEVGLAGVGVENPTYGGVGSVHRTNDRGRNKELWEKFRATHGELSHLSEVIVGKVVDYMDTLLLWEPDPVSDANKGTKMVTKLPSSTDVYVMLPPHVFGNLDDPGWQARIPRTDAEMAELRAAYEANRSHWWVNDPNVSGTDVGRDSEEAIFWVLQYIRENGLSIDEAAWEAYRQHALAEARSNGVYHGDPIAHFRFQSVNASFRAPNQHVPMITALGVKRQEYSMGTFVRPRHRHTSMSTSTTPADYVILPVGEYGDAWTRRLVHTAVFAKGRANPASREVEVREVAAAHEGVLRRYTARGKNAPADVPAHEVLGYVAEEGVVSSIQTMSLLTAEKVDGYDDPDALLQAIIDNGLIEELTRAIPMGVIAPMALSGTYIPGLVQNMGNGKLRLNPEKMVHIRAGKDRQVIETHAAWRRHEADASNRQPDALGLICPAAMPKGALQKLNKALFRALATTKGSA